MILPPNTTLITEYHDSNEYVIKGMQTHVFAFAVYGTKYTKVEVAHAMFSSRESFTINVWFSKTPVGDFLYNLPINLRNFHPVNTVRQFVFYPKHNDFSLQSTTFHDALFDQSFDEGYHRHRKKREFTNCHSIDFEVEGTYYINIQNLTNREDGYYLKIERERVDETF